MIILPRPLAGLLRRGGPGHDATPTAWSVVISETPFITWNTALDAVRHRRLKQYGTQGNLNAISAAGNEEATNGNIISGMYPDISTEPWAEYRAALDEGDIDTRRPTTTTASAAWARGPRTSAFTQIA